MSQQRPFNPSEQVERIREILVGRELGKFERRLGKLESTQVQNQSIQEGSPSPSQSELLIETKRLREEIQHESSIRRKQVSQLSETISKQVDTPPQSLSLSLDRHLSRKTDSLKTELVARLDAHTREILDHLQTEISQWKNQMDADLQKIRETALDRQELNLRMSRLASAAMEDDRTTSESDHGYLS